MTEAFSIQSCVPLTNQGSSILTNQECLLDQSILDDLESHLYEGRDFCPYKPAPLCSISTLSLSTNTENCVSQAELKHLRCPTRAEQSRPVQARTNWHRMEQTKSQQNRPAQNKADQQGGELSGQRVLAPGLLHSYAVSQLSRIKFPFFF